MNKLVINSVKINSVNGQNLPIKEFTGGFNIICGANEAGKSTMMKFLKEALFTPKDLSGDIEIEKSGTKYLVKVDGKKSKNARLKVLAPVDKSIEEVLDGFDRNFYQRAFTINLDDINSIDTELFGLIQDHNAPALAVCKSKLEDELREYLTETWKPGKKLSAISKKIADIDLQIRELSGKEEEYSKITSLVNTIQHEIETTHKLIEAKEQFIASYDLKAQLDKLQEETSLIEKNFNRKLSDNKQLFYELSKKTELITGYFEEINKLASSKTSQMINEKISGIKLRYNIEIVPEKAEEIDVSRDIEEKVRKFILEIEKQKDALANLESKKQDLIKNAQSVSDEINNLQIRAEKLQITDIDIYERALNELKSSITTLADVSGKTDCNTKDLRLAAGNLIIAVCLILLGIFLFATSVKSGIFIAAAGVILCGLTVPLFFNRNKDNKTSEIYNYLKNNIMPVFNRSEFLFSISALDRIVYESEGKLNEYTNLAAEINSKNAILNSTQKEIDDIEANMCTIAKTLEESTASLRSVTAVNGQLLSPEVFIDFLEEVRRLRELLIQLNTETAQKQTYEETCNKYLADFSAFLTSSGLDSLINPLFLREKVNEIQNKIEENDKLKSRMEDNHLRIRDIAKKLESSTVEDMSPDRTLEEIKETYEALINERARLMQEKRGLEEFEGLIALRNERNLLQNRLQDIINTLYSQKLALNIIEYAEKQQRSAEPNLMSAEKLLKEITGGKYISANFADRTITSKDGEIKQEKELSRGTREQLYLAFRLGYALNYGEDDRKYRLPLIIDDAFVNFDKERLSYMLNALKEFSKTNQILFFTCHKDYILSLAGTGINVVDV